MLIDRQAPAPAEPKWDWSGVGSGSAPIDEAPTTTVDDDVNDADAAEFADALAEDGSEEA